MGLGVVGGTWWDLCGTWWWDLLVGLGVFNVGLMWDLLVGLDQWDLGGTWWDLCGDLISGTYVGLGGTCKENIFSKN